MNEHGIAWPSDIKYRYANLQPQNFNTDPNVRGGGEQGGIAGGRGHSGARP